VSSDVNLLFHGCFSQIARNLVDIFFLQGGILIFLDEWIDLDLRGPQLTNKTPSSSFFLLAKMNYRCVVFLSTVIWNKIIFHLLNFKLRLLTTVVFLC
jgi:hypothetical protein